MTNTAQRPGIESPGRRVPRPQGHGSEHCMCVCVDVQRTLKRREATVEDQLKIAKLALGQDDGGQALSLGRELGVARRIASEQVLEDTTVGRVRHCVWNKI